MFLHGPQGEDKPSPLQPNLACWLEAAGYDILVWQTLLAQSDDHGYKHPEKSRHDSKQT